ncbi:MAG: hypothetical protein M1458_02205 [Deltaproteobacteria bacterium]|nr:hypothetical protein [Deltaproteobacteria bacterium]
MKKNKKLLNNINGLTAVELIIALTISLIIVGAAAYILLSQSGAMRLSRSVSTEQENLNIVFNTVKYNLRMAGFDYGNNYYSTHGSAPPVEIFQPDYPNDPYEVLISYSTLINDYQGACYVTQDGANYDLGSNCNINNFYEGQIINIIDPSAPSTGALSSPGTLCVTGEPADGKIQTRPGNTQHICPFNNSNPPNIPSGGYVSTIQQVLFYWGNQYYGNRTSGFNPPFNQAGNLYECVLAQPTNVQPAPTSCEPNTTIMLDGNVNDFSITPLGSENSEGYYYLYALTISGSSGAAVTPSPAFSVNTDYNPNMSGANPQQNGSAIPGYNIVKTLGANIFLRNVYYES